MDPIQQSKAANATFFSFQDVEEAIELHEAGRQQLRPIPTSEMALFYTPISHNGHNGVGEICINPIQRDGSPNPFYEPRLRYIQCCSNAPLSQFLSLYQLVYDVYIRPIQWTFKNDVIHVPYLTEEASFPCPTPDMLQDALRSEREAKRSANKGNTAASRNGRNASESAKRKPYPAPNSLGGKRQKLRLEQDSPEQDSPERDSPERDSPERDSPERDSPEQNHPTQHSSEKNRLEEHGPDQAGPEADQIVAEVLVRKLVKERPRVKSQRPGRGLPTDLLLGARAQMTNEDLLSAYEELAMNLSSLGEERDNAKAFRWRIHFTASCMWYVLRRRRRHIRKDSWNRQADGAYMINLTANILCDGSLTDGAKFYAGLAAQNTTLSRMYDKSLDRRERFSKNLAKLLKDKLPSPLDDEIVCYPALVISEMWGEPYKQLCHELGLDKLSLLPEPLRKNMYDEGRSFRFGIPFKDVHSHASGKRQPTTESLPSFDENLSQLPLSEQSIADTREQGFNPKSRAMVSKGKEQIAQIYAPIPPVQRDNPLNELADVAENQTRLPGNGYIATNTSPESCADSNDSMDELINWSQPEFPVISPELQLRISGAHLCNVKGHQMRQLQFQEQQHDSSLTAYQIIDVPDKVKAIRDMAVKELSPRIRASAEGPLKWRSKLIYLPRGGLRTQKRTFKSLVIPIRMCKQQAPSFRLDWGDERGAATPEGAWPLAIIEGPVTCRSVDGPLLLIAIRYFERKHWDWLNGIGIEEQSYSPIEDESKTDQNGEGPAVCVKGCECSQ